MGFLKTGASAIGKLFIVAVLGAAFLVGLFGVVYLSLRGEEIKVPEVVGKDFSESEKELTHMGLKIKKRATRYSQEKPNTVLEQSPKAGETAKTGQLILVVVSQLNPESTEAPATVEKDEETTVDETGDKPKKTNKNANVKKPTQTTRDVSSNKTNKNSNTDSGSGETTKSNTSSGNTTKPVTSPAANKSTTTPASSPKPTPNKTPTSGDTRTRRVPN